MLLPHRLRSLFQLVRESVRGEERDCTTGPLERTVFLFAAALETEVSAVTAGLSSVEEVFQNMALPDVGPLVDGPAPELLSGPPPVPVSQ
jgi:hypothetical protein